MTGILTGPQDCIQHQHALTHPLTRGWLLDPEASFVRPWNIPFLRRREPLDAFVGAGVHKQREDIGRHCQRYPHSMEPAVLELATAHAATSGGRPFPLP